MAVVVVGGQARNVGKTSVAAGLIAAMREMRWTAIKLTSHAHAGCDVFDEQDAGSGTDTGRYLAAGAVRSLLIQGELSEAMVRVRAEIAGAENVMVESNSVLEFVQPDVFVMVLDVGNKDFKDSARRYLDRADAVVVMGEMEGILLEARRFRGSAERYCSAELVEFVRGRMCERDES
jgi:hypothetical protein